MEPNLVDYNKIFEKKITPPTPPIKKLKPIQEIDYYTIFFNCIGFIIICFGIWLLYYRNQTKNKNERIYNQRVFHFFHEVM